MSEPEWTLCERVEVVAGEPWTLVGLDDFGRAAVAVDAWLRTRPLREREDGSPMFGVMWSAGRALADRVAAADLRGRTVLELGCGLGLASLVAARGGARVLATDHHVRSGAFLARNAERNGVRVPFRRLDWREPPDLGHFDHVMASDVLFARENPAWVAAAFHRYLAPGGVGWLTDPGRAWLPELSDACRGLGLDVDVDVAVIERADHRDEVFFLEIRRR